ncbi:hypothetical protein [Nocardia sp. NPDC059228]|uniref:hypothetical protein n=1 Tax=Nocardia sp. NPDC059228 TaxID=3346777 RepID=UPI0036A54B87
MSTTHEPEAEAPPDFDVHRAELAAARSKAAMVRYAAAQLGPDATPPQVRDWLASYGFHVPADIKPSTLYENVPKADPNAKEPESVSPERSVTDTSDLPKLTPQELAALDAVMASAAAPPDPVTRPVPMPRRTVAVETNVPEGTVASGVRAGGVEYAVPVEPIPEPDRAEPEPVSGVLESGVRTEPGPDRVPDSPVAGSPEPETGPDRSPGVDTDNTRTPEQGPDLSENRFRVLPDFGAGSGPESGLAESGLGREFRTESGMGPDRSPESGLSGSGHPDSVPGFPEWIPDPGPESGVWSPEPRMESGPEQQSRHREPPAGEWLFYLAAVVPMITSLDTSWNLFHRLGVENVAERVAMFAGLELGFIACAVHMGLTIRKRHQEPSPFVRLVLWALCGISVYGAVVGTGLELGLARVMFGPAISMMMLHLALMAERRANGAKNGTFAKIGRELRERFLSRLGLGDDERDAAQRTRDRALTRAAALSQPGWRLFRTRRLQRAFLAAGVADDPVLRERLLARRKVVHSAREFIALDQGAAWSE